MNSHWEEYGKFATTLCILGRAGSWSPYFGPVLIAHSNCPYESIIECDNKCRE